MILASIKSFGLFSRLVVSVRLYGRDRPNRQDRRELGARNIKNVFDERRTLKAERSFRTKTVTLAVGLALLFFLAGFTRPVRITGDHGSGILWLWAWQKGKVEFINSVTGRPVMISFKMPWRFSDFSVRTDPGTEEYYTAGGYSWSKQLAGERTGTLQYCSEVGITLTLGGKVVHEQEGCIRAALLWPFYY